MSNMRANFGCRDFCKNRSLCSARAYGCGSCGRVNLLFHSSAGYVCKFRRGTLFPKAQTLPYNLMGTQNIFTIASNEGFGSYSVSDCFVKIVPNVDEAHDFDFMLSGEVSPYLYGAESDLSAAFGGRV